MSSPYTDALNQSVTDFGLLHDVVHGDAGVAVPTENGTIPSVAKVITSIGDRVVASLSSTSTTALTVATGTQLLTVEPGKSFRRGQIVNMVSDTASMLGSVMSYTNDQLTVNVTDIQGSGTFSNWTVSFSGPRGPASSAANGGSSEKLLIKMPWEN